MQTSKDVSIEIIGYISSCFTEKFATPRQPGLVPSAPARLKLIEPFNREEMVRGLETFSHVWIQFLFHQALGDGWKTTVRPPRLGGVERKGIYATRSPHRPNFIGLSAVALDRIEFDNGVELVLNGVDLLDGTPVIDIKPYLPSSDRLHQASEGWASHEFARLEVEFTPEAAAFCRRYEERTAISLLPLITEVLGEDPRPSYQRGKKEEFGMRLFNVNIGWQVSGNVALVCFCEEEAEKS